MPISPKSWKKLSPLFLIAATALFAWSVWAFGGNQTNLPGRWYCTVPGCDSNFGGAAYGADFVCLDWIETVGGERLRYRCCDDKTDGLPIGSSVLEDCPNYRQI